MICLNVLYKRSLYQQTLDQTKSKSFNVLTPVLSETDCFIVSFKAIDCASIDWHVTNSSINATEVIGSTRVTAKNSTDNELSRPVEQNTVNLQSLYPGAGYNVSLWYDFTESQKLLQCSQNLTLGELRCPWLEFVVIIQVHIMRQFSFFPLSI